MHDHISTLEPPRSMGLPITNAKLAMWLFLATEIMFFSGLIGAYIVLRFGSPMWPTPHDVHLVEWMGAINTFVLICSSVSVVLALKALRPSFPEEQPNVARAVSLILLTFVLGGVFMVIKAFEYKAKYEHGILPWSVRESVGDALKEGIGNYKPAGQNDAALAAARALDDKIAESEFTRGEQLEQYHELAEKHPELNLPEVIPMGNLWASIYFTLTGIHALHVLGGMVIFVVMLIMAIMGRFGPGQAQFVELSGLYWHFVDIVWIFLFPMLYLLG